VGSDDLSFLSRYDGLQAFRLTPLGAYLLGLETRLPAAAVASSVALSFSPGAAGRMSCKVRSRPRSRCCSTTGPSRSRGSWRLDREKSLSAIEKGHDIAELKGFLESTGGQPLPAPVDSFIDFCERNGKALKTLGSAVLIECRDPEIADEIAGRRETAARCVCAPGQKRSQCVRSSWTSFARRFACSASG
jgi:hypothetical protein